MARIVNDGPLIPFTLEDGTEAELRLGPDYPSPPPSGELNVLLYMLDDLGHPELAMFDGTNAWQAAYPYAKTPTLDALAAESVLFTRAYANPWCSPTRATGLSGLRSSRTLIGKIISDGDDDFTLEDIPEDWTSMPSLYGGVTGPTVHSGKWHLGKTVTTDPSGPREVGRFRESFGTQQSPGQGGQINGQQPNWNRYRYVTIDPASGVPSIEVVDDSTRHLALQEHEDVMSWLAEHQEDDGWLLVRWVHPPHGPFDPAGGAWLQPAIFQAPAGEGHPDAIDDAWHSMGPSSDWTGGVAGNPQVIEVFRQELEYFDTMLARELAALSPEVRARTVIIVYTDNGTPTACYSREFSPELETLDPAEIYAPNRAKGTTYEMGARVPLFVWGGAETGIQQGVVNSSPVEAADIYATVLDLKGQLANGTPDMDGISLLPILRGDTDSVREYQFTGLHGPLGSSPALADYRSSALARADGYKLMRVVNPTWPTEPQVPGLGETREELYNVVTDPWEQTDLMGQVGTDQAITEAYEDLAERLSAILGDTSVAIQVSAEHGIQGHLWVDTTARIPFRDEEGGLGTVAPEVSDELGETGALLLISTAGSPIPGGSSGGPGGGGGGGGEPELAWSSLDDAAWWHEANGVGAAKLAISMAANLTFSQVHKLVPGAAARAQYPRLVPPPGQTYGGNGTLVDPNALVPDHLPLKPRYLAAIALGDITEWAKMQAIKRWGSIDGNINPESELVSPWLASRQGNLGDHSGARTSQGYYISHADDTVFSGIGAGGTHGIPPFGFDWQQNARGIENALIKWLGDVNREPMAAPWASMLPWIFNIWKGGVGPWQPPEYQGPLAPHLPSWMRPEEKTEIGGAATFGGGWTGGLHYYYGHGATHLSRPTEAAFHLAKHTDLGIVRTWLNLFWTDLTQTFGWSFPHPDNWFAPQWDWTLNGEPWPDPWKAQQNRIPLWRRMDIVSEGAFQGSPSTGGLQGDGLTYGYHGQFVRDWAHIVRFALNMIDVGLGGDPQQVDTPAWFIERAMEMLDAVFTVSHPHKDSVRRACLGFTTNAATSHQWPENWPHLGGEPGTARWQQSVSNHGVWYNELLRLSVLPTAPASVQAAAAELKGYLGPYPNWWTTLDDATLAGNEPGGPCGDYGEEGSVWGVAKNLVDVGPGEHALFGTFAGGSINEHGCPSEKHPVCEDPVPACTLPAERDREDQGWQNPWDPRWRDHAVILGWNHRIVYPELTDSADLQATLVSGHQNPLDFLQPARRLELLGW